MLKLPKFGKVFNSNVLTVLLLLFNALDTIFTIFFIQYGPIDEFNPVPDYFLKNGAFPFVIYKLVTIGALIVILWDLQKYSISRKGLVFLSTIYFMLMLWWLGTSYVVLLS